MKKEDKEHIILRWQLMWFRISAEGVIDSYQLCKHAEELFGKSYII